MLAKIIAAMLREHKKLQHLSIQVPIVQVTFYTLIEKIYGKGGRDAMGDNGILALAPVFAKCKLEILELQVKFLAIL